MKSSRWQPKWKGRRNHHRAGTSLVPTIVTSVPGGAFVDIQQRRRRTRHYPGGGVQPVNMPQASERILAEPGCG